MSGDVRRYEERFGAGVIVGNRKMQRLVVRELARTKKSHKQMPSPVQRKLSQAYCHTTKPIKTPPGNVSAETGSAV